MKRLCAHLAALLLPLGSSTGVAAATAWQWSFTESVIDVSVTPTAHVSFSNSLGSDAEIRVTGIDIFSFGHLGLLFEPGFAGMITPLVYAVDRVVQPGQSGQAPALLFQFNPFDLPTPGVRYEISPLLQALSGPNCDSPQDDQCVWVSQGPTRPLTIVYGAVPEPGTWLQLAAGLLVLGVAGGRAGRLRRRCPEHR